MRKHVTPTDPGASIPDLVHGGTLPPEGIDVEYTGYWSLLAQRGDIIVTDAVDAGGDSPPPTVPVLFSDRVTTRREAEALYPTVAQLETYHLRAGGPFQAAIAAGGDPGTPLGLPPIVAALIFG